MTPAEVAEITYVGIDKRGAARTGRGTMNAAEFIEACFDLGWRELTVKFAETGEEIGSIGTNPTGERGWWAFS